jgi:serralysin
MSFHQFHISEVFSNANGTVQYVVFTGEQDGQNVWGNKSMTMTATGQPTKTFSFGVDLPNAETMGKTVLVATQGFADLGLVTPDYIMPAGFLFPGGGTLSFPNMDSITFSAMPTNGYTAISENGTTTVAGTPSNFAGDSVELNEGSGIPAGTFYNGSAANNTITGTANHDGIFGNAGADVLGGSGGNDNISGGDGKDNCAGGDGNDTLRGGNDNDSLNGNAGTDRLFGDAGSDTLFYGAGDMYNGGAGTDTVKVNTGNVDLSSLPDSWFVSIEQFDLVKGAHTLKLTKSDVLSMSPTDQIKILGDAGDTVNIVGTQVEGATTNGFTRYTIGSAVLLIDADINVT